MTATPHTAEQSADAVLVERPSTSAKAGFFQVTLSELKRIVADGGGRNELAAYMVLCGGVNGRQHARVCTHGANSVRKRTGMGYRIAERAIAWLELNGFISKPGPDEPEYLGRGHARSLKVRHVIAHGAPDVAISRQFLDGVRGGARPPLMHLLNDVNGSENIPRSQAVADAILLFAALMQEQDFGEWSGVNPEAWFERFVYVEAEETNQYGHVLVMDAVEKIEGMDGVLVTLKGAPESTSHTRFIEHALGGDAATDDELTERFWHALEELRRLRIAYRVIVMWQGDPLDPKSRFKSEPMATLYINDPWARELDPFLQYEINRALWRLKTRDPYDAGDFDSDGDFQYTDTGIHRYIVRAGSEGTVAVIGQLRVRYWPASESVVAGRKVEHRRTEGWKAHLSKLARR